MSAPTRTDRMVLAEQLRRAGWAIVADRIANGADVAATVERLVGMYGESATPVVVIRKHLQMRADEDREMGEAEGADYTEAREAALGAIAEGRVPLEVLQEIAGYGPAESDPVDAAPPSMAKMRHWLHHAGMRPTSLSDDEVRETYRRLYGGAEAR